MNTAICPDKIKKTRDTYMTKQEAIQECLKVVKNELAAKILVDKYFLCDEKGYHETQPQQMWDRLAKANSLAEKETIREQYEQEFRHILDDFKFVPGGRILYGLGNKMVNTTLKNCYVIAIQEDSIKGIFDAAYKMAETYKQGGGCGIDISILRPKGSPIKNAARESTGATSFMDFYSHITGMIGQKARIGALLISLDVSHPDIEDFINIKGGDDLDKVRFANISVKITDEFMKDVENNADFDLKWGGKVYRTVKASKLWGKIINRAWRRAEPGILFWDTACRNGPSHNYENFKLITTNPCVSGDTKILTPEGYKTARELWIEGGNKEYGDKDLGERYIINSSGKVRSTDVYMTSEISDLFRTTFEDGSYIDTTKNHKFLLKDNNSIIRKPLHEVKVGDEVPVYGSDNFLGIVSIDSVGKGETFCLTEPENNEFVANGIRTGNCGEIGLSDGDSCNLGSMNLSKYVASPFTGASRFNFDGFERDVKSSIRFLDNIISLEKSPLEFQQWANDNGRRLGLGVMGMADMLVKLRIKYDSKESMEFLEKLFDSLMCASYTASCDLAEEKGPFAAFDYNTHMKSEFTQRLPKSIRDRIKSVGLRNISINAIAPTGTLALIAQCSASIEPVFMNHYIRKTNLGTAKKVEEHKVYHPTVKEYMDTYGGELPDYFVEAHDVDPLFRTVVQGMIQGKIDNSISQTCNLPEDATEEHISVCYMNAWKEGCKGITVYREGSREGVLVKESDTRSKEITVHQAPQRPKELPARVHVIKPNGMEYAIFVGFLNNRVYEVFALDNNDVGIKDGIKGKIKKVSTDDGSIYVFENRAMFVNQLNRYEDSDASLITRLLSTALRHGTPLEFAIDQISKSKIVVNSFARAIARALSLYIKPEEVVGKFKCPECKSVNLKYEGTCFSCLSCGYSKCT
jgi:ribonucleoside-diphosphate reductase alpha chain